MEKPQSNAHESITPRVHESRCADFHSNAHEIHTPRVHESRYANFHSKVSPDEFTAIMQRGLPWAATLGISIDRMSAGNVIMRLPYRSDSVRPGGSISGPHMMLLADACMFAVVLSLIGPVELAVTTNLNINFLRKPRESDLLAHGKIIKLGKRLAIMEVSIYSETGDQIVAHTTGTYSIPPQST